MYQSVRQRLLKILLVEDNPLDARLMVSALQAEKNWPTEIAVTCDGDEAISYLQQGSASESAAADLVILDLNLPKRDGAEVLHFIRSTNELRTLPVIVLSSAPEDVSEGILRRVNLDANGYITKPTDVDDFLAIGSVVKAAYDRIVNSEHSAQQVTSNSPDRHRPSTRPSATFPARHGRAT
jgi:two-component system, chemotaxis family, response regulator Rcp1